MTKFMTIDGKEKEPKNKTVFKNFLSKGLVMSDGEDKCLQPADYDNVMYIGYNNYYGDVFKAWNNGDITEYVLYFGTKGDEFND